MNNKTLASVVKEAREKINISQRELSRITGIDNNTIAKIEKGEMKPSIYKVLSLEDANEALDILERGENIGKVVLRVCNE